MDWMTWFKETRRRLGTFSERKDAKPGSSL
jgi:hypothetical protein